MRFMKTGSRLGFVTPASWLTADYAASLQRTLLGPVRLRAIIASNAKSFFSQVDVNTVLLIAGRLGDDATDEPIRFVTLKRPISQLTAGKEAYWSRFVQLVDDIEGANSSIKTTDTELNSLIPRSSGLR